MSILSLYLQVCWAGVRKDGIYVYLWVYTYKNGKKEKKIDRNTASQGVILIYFFVFPVVSRNL